MAEFKDYGLQYVNPNLVKIDPPLDGDWDTSKDAGGGLSRAQINEGLDRRKDVGALYERGYTDQDFARLRESSNPNEKEIGDSQRMFWGDQPISVTKTGDEMVSDNGRHRLDIAQVRGEHSLPMRVHAAADDPEFANKKFDAARQPSHGEHVQPGESMSERARNSYETPELNNPKETRPQVDEHPDLRAPREAAHQNRVSDRSGQTQNPATTDASADSTPSKDNDSTSKSDPMDGAQPAKVEGADKMDGAGDRAKKPDLDSRELADTNRGLG